MVRPMVELTKKGKRYVWSIECETSFAELKNVLISTDVMGYPLNDAGIFILDVDASDVSIGRVLHKVQNDREGDSLR